MKRKIIGTDSRLRLSVYKSNKNIFVQIINDEKNQVLTGVSSLSAEIKEKNFSSPKERAREIGKLIARKALEKKIENVFFDRGRYKYHGNVKELADGAREGGLKF